MSSFFFNARDRDTGEEVRVFAYDNYFGRRVYGYAVGKKVMNEEDFFRQYERVKESSCT